MPAPTPNPMRRLTRLQKVRGAKQDGWWVRLYGTGASTGRVLAQKVFSEVAYGDPDTALHAAQAWRDQQEITLGLPPRDRRNGPRQLYGDKRENVGVVLFVCERGDGSLHVEFKACICQESAPRYRGFAVRKYGYATAFLLAVYQRCTALGIALPPKVRLIKPTRGQARQLQRVGIAHPAQETWLPIDQETRRRLSELLGQRRLPVPRREQFVAQGRSLCSKDQTGAPPQDQDNEPRVGQPVTGVIGRYQGVSLDVRQRANGLFNATWQASFPPSQGLPSEHYAVRKYGYADAYRLAVYARCLAMGEALPERVRLPRPNRAQAALLRRAGISLPKDCPWLDFSVQVLAFIQAERRLRHHSA